MAQDHYQAQWRIILRSNNPTSTNPPMDGNQTYETDIYTRDRWNSPINGNPIAARLTNQTTNQVALYNMDYDSDIGGPLPCTIWNMGRAYDNGWGTGITLTQGQNTLFFETLYSPNSGLESFLPGLSNVNEQNKMLHLTCRINDARYMPLNHVVICGPATPLLAYKGISNQLNFGIGSSGVVSIGGVTSQTSFSHRLIQARYMDASGVAQNFSYTSGLNATNPIPTTSGITFSGTPGNGSTNLGTSLINFTPTVNGNYLLMVESTLRTPTLQLMTFQYPVWVEVRDPEPCCVFSLQITNNWNNYTTLSSTLPAATLSTLSSTSTKNVKIERILSIDRDLTINNANIIFGNGATIKVQSGRKLTINQSVLKACDQLWNGIEVMDGGILEIKDSEIWDAYKAIHATGVTASTSSIVINKVKFFQNYWGLNLKSYVNGTLKINECLFDCPDKISKPLYTTTGTPLAVMTQPQTNITYAGIELNNTWPAPTPGFSSLPITYTVFQNLANGILLNHSSLILRGSRFTNVLLTSVEAKSGVNDSRFPILNIETSNAFEELGHNNNPSASLPANSIKGIGVLVNGNYELLCGKSNGGPNVFHNYFRNVDAWAIRTQFTKGKTHTIQKNQFSNINWTAISMYENTSTSGLFLPSYLSNILIKENKIENPACPWATAITIEDVISSSKGQTQVQRNTISNSRNGVLVTNRANPQIQENNITMSGWKDEKSRNRGIYTVNCISTNYTSTATQLYILNNFVGMYSNVIASYLDVGLEIKQCPGAMIKFNTFNKTGRGIWYEGNNEKNTLACNRLISNDIGLLLIYSSSIGDQGSQTSVHNNEWYPVSGNLYDTYVEGSQGSFIYYKGNSNYPLYCPLNRNFDASYTSKEFRFLQANGNAQSLCNFIPTLQKKDLYVALKNASPTPLINERKWQSNFELARNFQYDSTLLSLDADFQLWSDSIQQTTTGKLANVHQSITNNEISLAKTQNQQINCACTNEHYLKQTNQIYLESFASGIDTFDANQRSILEMIAALNSIEHGHGVIQARVMLKAIGDTTQYADPLTGPGIPQGSNKMAPQELNQDKNIKIYPNPAQNEVLFENAEDASIQLFDFTGKLVLETEVKEGKINVASVPNGMYIVNLFRDKVQILQTKLSIQK